MLNAPSRQEVSDLLLPFMGQEGERRAVLLYAFGGDSPLLNQINYSGPADTFVTTLINTLENFGESAPGKPALWALLEALRSKVGGDRKQRIDALRPLFKLPPERLPDRCFVSYSRKDEAFALRLVSDLTDAGLRVWFDRHKIKGGEAWWQSIEQGIQNADFVVFCLSPHSLQSEVANRELETARSFEKEIIPIMLAPVVERLRDSAYSQIAWLSEIHLIDCTEPARYGSAFQELLGALPGYNPPDPYFDLDPTHIPNPFRGLEAFREIDHHYFAGREAEIREMLSRLTPDHSRVLAVVGASGSGKSSLVRAGLIPALREQKNHFALWESATFTPGKEPLRALAERLALRTEIPAFNLRDTLMRPDGLHDVVTEIMRGKPDDARFLLVVDQFEELFTLSTEADRKVLIDALYRAAVVEGGRTQIILTMRADFFDRLGAHPTLAELIESNLLIAKELSPEALRRSIEAPAHKVGLIYDEGLIDRLLEAVREQPGSLPLLQFALKELYERRLGRRLTQQSYDEMGGVQGALATRADALYEALGESQQALVKRVLLRLIEVGEESLTRRRVERSELAFKGVSAAEVQGVLDRLTAPDVRLLVATSPIGDKDATNDLQVFYEVSHEALITHWARLAGWVQHNRAQLRLDSDLRRIAADWQAEHNPQKRSDYLLRGVRLDEAQAWLHATDAATPAQQAFITASVVNQSEIIAAEQKRIAELNAATRQARRTRQRLLITTAFAAVMITAAIVAAYFGLQGQQAAAQREGEANLRVLNLNQTLTPVSEILATAQEEGVRAKATSTRIALTIKEGEAQIESLRLAGEAANILSAGGNAESAALLSVRGLRTAYSAQADAALVKAAERLYTRRIFRSGSAFVHDVAFSPDGTLMVTAEEGGMVRLWRLSTGELMRTFQGAGLLSRVVFGPDGRTILTGSSDGTARLWEVNTGTELRRFGGHTEIVTDVAYVGGGKTLITGGYDSTVRLWDAATGAELRELRDGISLVSTVAASPDGKWIMAGDYDGVVTLWETAQWQMVRQFKAHPKEITGAAFSPDGATFLTSSKDHTVRLWDVENGSERLQLRGHTDQVNSAVFSPDGKTLLTSSADLSVRLWEVETGREVRVLSGHLRELNRAVFSPDGQTILSAANDGTARWWGLTPVILSPRFEGTLARFSPDGKTILTGGTEVTLWDAATGAMHHHLSSGLSGAWQVSFVSDGRTVLGGKDDGSVWLWDTASGETVRTFEGMMPVHSMALSPDGTQIALTSYVGGGWVLDRHTGSTLVTLNGSSGGVHAVAFSPDGRYLVGGSANFENAGDGIVRLWRADSGEEIRQFVGHIGYTHAVAFSPDGKLLVTASADNTARLWEVESGRQVRLLSGHTDEVLSAVFSPDGTMILTGSADNTVRLWEVESGRTLRVYSGHTNRTNSAVFSPDGRYVLTAGDDGTARLWETFYGDFVTEVCARLVRDLSRDERIQFALPERLPTCPELAGAVIDYEFSVEGEPTPIYNDSAYTPLPPTTTPYPTAVIPIWTPIPTATTGP